MSKGIPQIHKYMTATPKSVHPDASLDEALNLMIKNEIRHLPVRIDTNKFGLISEKDIHRILSFSGANPKTLKVGDLCWDNVVTVSPETPISEVSQQMAEKKIGSVLVVDNNHLVGIVTTIDICRALTDLCEGRFIH